MKNLCLLLVFISMFFSQETLKIAKINANYSFEFNQILQVNNDDELFYDRIAVSYLNSKYFVLDWGNKVVHVLNEQGEKIHEFGKEGNGPGEFPFPLNIEAVGQNLWIDNLGKAGMFFTQDGKLIKELDIKFHRGQMLFEKNSITRIDKMNKTYLVKFNSFGDIMLSKSDSSLVGLHKERRKRGAFMTGKFPIIKFNEDYLTTRKGDYYIDLLDENFDVKSSYYRDYAKVLNPDNNYDFGTKKLTKNQLAIQAQLKKENVYLNSVKALIGEYNEHLFVSTASASEDIMLIDVLDKNYNLVQEITFELENAESTGSIIGNKLIFECKDDEQGPYFKVFEIQMKKN